MSASSSGHGETKRSRYFVSLIFFILSRAGSALDNGVASTPPMGWMSWQRFKCNVDCRLEPKSCIGESLIKRMVKVMVAEGYVLAGYNYVAIDDCWLSKKRDADGNLQPDYERFPSGIEQLVNFIHDHDMKFGIYGAVGPYTCMKFPGNSRHIQRDAYQYAQWGVDMFKFDGCFVPLSKLQPAYVSMSRHLNQTERHIVYLCSWPYYLLLGGKQPPWDDIKRHCNIWRVADDVSESLESILNIVHTYEKLQPFIAELAGPGSWNDADQLLIGNDGLTEDDCHIQMAMWAILASPLFMSVDLEEIDDWAKDLLKNERIIAINQDPLGRQGVKLPESPPEMGIWVKELSGDRLAIAFLGLQQPHKHEDAVLNVTIRFSLFKSYFAHVGSSSSKPKFLLVDAFSGDAVGTFSFDGKFPIEKDNVASVMLVTLSLVSDSRNAPSLETRGEEDDEEEEEERRRAASEWTAMIDKIKADKIDRKSLSSVIYSLIVSMGLAFVVVFFFFRFRHLLYRTLLYILPQRRGYKLRTSECI